MRKFWLSFGWMGAIGSVIDALIVIYAVMIILTTADYGWTLSSEILFRDHLTWLYWVKQLAYLFLDADFIDWVFGLPAVVFFTVRIVVSGLMGKWAFNQAARIDARVTA
ncbi:MAG: hypothetical protein GKR90_25165 [Pseudomonadales bacterium]|nr:hypothetical protein [Pseudomonadales bacterium]